jgi:tRNA nucleotidyltransferase/poly(A) polymerase
MLNRLKGVFASFQRQEVKYLVIGGIAAILHGVPRATFDLDILIEATPENAKNLLDALMEAGLGTATLTTAEDLLSNEITVFKDRARIDVQTSTPGIVFGDAWKRREKMVFQGQEFYVVSKEDLIVTKRASGHEIDLSDVRLLEIREEKKEKSTDA